MIASRSLDLSARIARLERILDALDDSRRSIAQVSTGPPPDAQPSLDRLREASALLQQRATQAECDAGDAIAMRVVLEEYRSCAAGLRVDATAVGERVNAIRMALAELGRRLGALEDIVSPPTRVDGRDRGRPA